MLFGVWQCLKHHYKLNCFTLFPRNPQVQIAAMEAGALQKLLVLLATDHPVAIKKKVWMKNKPNLGQRERQISGGSQYQNRTKIIKY